MFIHNTIGAHHNTISQIVSISNNIANVGQVPCESH